ncbi:MAG: hypothetical protein ACK502_03915 [Alphaproteobacteria bacterium]
MKREWKIRISWLILGLLIGSIPMCSRWLTVDNCLDEGGRWNEEKKECEF